MEKEQRRSWFCKEPKVHPAALFIVSGVFVAIALTIPLTIWERESCLAIGLLIAAMGVWESARMSICRWIKRRHERVRD